MIRGRSLAGTYPTSLLMSDYPLLDAQIKQAEILLSEQLKISAEWEALSHDYRNVRNIYATKVRHAEEKVIALRDIITKHDTFKADRMAKDSKRECQ